MRNGRGNSGGRDATYHCYKCNKLGHRSFECLENEETRHQSTHIVYGKEKGLSPQAMDETPEIGVAWS